MERRLASGTDNPIAWEGCSSWASSSHAANDGVRETAKATRERILDAFKAQQARATKKAATTRSAAGAPRSVLHGPDVGLRAADACNQATVGVIHENMLAPR